MGPNITIAFKIVGANEIMTVFSDRISDSLFSFGIEFSICPLYPNFSSYDRYKTFPEKKVPYDVDENGK